MTCYVLPTVSDKKTLRIATYGLNKLPIHPEEPFVTARRKSGIRIIVPTMNSAALFSEMERDFRGKRLRECAKQLIVVWSRGIAYPMESFDARSAHSTYLVAGACTVAVVMLVILPVVTVVVIRVTNLLVHLIQNEAYYVRP